MDSLLEKNDGCREVAVSGVRLHLCIASNSR